jgi:hypothetical protein
MMIARNLSWMALCGVLSGTVLAQQPATPAPPTPKPTAQSEAGEPQADTSIQTPAPQDAPASAPAAATGRVAAKGRAPAAASPGAPASPASPAAPAAGAKAASKVDRLDLGTATVTGDREQPKVMYIVPWKRSDIGDLSAKPMNSLVDEILAPVDRDVFKREVVYYHAVQADASQNDASPKPAQQGEK